MAADENDARKRRGCGCGCASLFGGIVLILVGLPMLVLPGPGIAVIAAGALMVLSGLGLRRKQSAAVSDSAEAATHAADHAPAADRTYAADDVER